MGSALLISSNYRKPQKGGNRQYWNSEDLNKSLNYCAHFRSLKNVRDENSKLVKFSLYSTSIFFYMQGNPKLSVGAVSVKSIKTSTKS